MNAKTILSAAVLAAVLAGCDRDRQASTASSAPNATTEPAVVFTATTPATAPASVGTSAPIPAPATQPVVAEEPARATFYVGQQQVWFPPAILRLTPADGRLSARLSTDDPPSAIEDNYHGNSFDLDMSLDIAAAKDIGQATWMYKSVSSEQQDDSPHGIFLDGQRRRLHPQDVVAQFQQAGPRVVVLLRGWFLMYDTAQNERSFTLPERVFVQGRLETTVPQK